jgi:hypothetical protein
MKATYIGKAIWIVNGKKTIEVNTRNVPMKMILREVSDKPRIDINDIEEKKEVKKNKKKSKN